MQPKKEDFETKKERERKRNYDRGRQREKL